MSRAHYNLDNLLLIIDYNGLQIDGTNDEVMNVRPLGEKFKALAGIQFLLMDMTLNQLLLAVIMLKPLKESRQ